jgi:hypothetical protein
MPVRAEAAMIACITSWVGAGCPARACQTSSRRILVSPRLRSRSPGTGMLTI